MSESTLVLGVDSRQVDKGAKSLDELAKAGAKAETSTTKIAKSADVLANSSKYAAGAITAVTAATIALVKTTIDSADAMNDLHLKTGLAFKDLAMYEQMARQSGTTIDGVAQGFKFLGKYMVEHGDKLKQIGVTSKDTNTAMRQFADVISSIEDPALRSTLAMTVLGRSGTDMIPMLLGGSDAFDEASKSTKAYGEALARVAPEADKLNDRWEVIKTGASTFALEITEKLLPALNALLLIGTMNPLKSTGENVKSLREEIESLNEDRERFIKSNADTSAIDSALAALNKRYSDAKEIQRAEALAMGKDYANYKQPSSGVNKSVTEMLAKAAKEKKQERFKQEFDAEADFWFAVEEARLQNHREANMKMLAEDELLAKKEIERQNQLRLDAEKAFAENIASAFDGLLAPGTNVMDKLAQNFGDAVNKSVNEALANVSINVATGKTSETSSGDWVMLVIGIVASIVSSQTASAAEIAAVTAAEVQKRQGAGTVLGAAAEQSASILDSLEAMQKNTFAMSDHTYSMMRSLDKVATSMDSFITVLAQSLGGNIAANLGVSNSTGGQTMWGSRSSELTSWLEGRPAGSPLANTPGSQNLSRMADVFSKAVWGEVETAVTDTGLLISGQLSNLQVGQYAAGTSSTSGLFGSGLGASTDTWMQTGAADPALAAALNMIYGNIAGTFKALGKTLNVEMETVDSVFANFSTTIGQLSLFGLSAEDQVKALNDAISKDADLLAAQLFPAMVQFQQAGEGMLETLTRIVNGIATLDTWYSVLGKTVTSTTAATDAFITSLGGVERASEMMGKFVKNFAPAVDQAALAGRQLTAAGLPLLTTTQAWWEFAKTASEEQTVALLENQDAIGSWVSQIDEATKKLSGLVKQNAFKSMVDYTIYMDRVMASGISNAMAGTTSAGLSINDSIPKFADGGSHFGGLRLVGERGPELESTGPSMITSTEQLMSRLTNPANDVLVTEIRALRKEVSALRAASESTANSTGKTQSLLRNVTRDGNSLLTTAV